MFEVIGGPVSTRYGRMDSDRDAPVSKIAKGLWTARRYRAAGV